MLNRSTNNDLDINDHVNEDDDFSIVSDNDDSMVEDSGAVTLHITSNEGLNLGLRYTNGTFEILNNDRVVTEANANDATALLEHFCRSGSYLKWVIQHSDGTESPKFAILQPAVFHLLQFFSTGVSHQLNLNALDVTDAKMFHIAGIEFTYLPNNGNGLFCLSRGGHIYWAESDPWTLTALCVYVLAMPLGGRSDVPLMFPFGIVNLDWSKLGTDFSAVHFMQIFKWVAKHNGSVLYQYIPELENILPDEQYRNSSPKEQVYMALSTIRRLLHICKLEAVVVKIAGITTPRIVVYRRNNPRVLLFNHNGVVSHQAQDDTFVENLNISDSITITVESW